MIKSVFNTINIPVPRKPDFSNQMQILTLTDKLATIGDFFLNFCGTISNFPPSFNRINNYLNIYGIFSVCQNQITYHTFRDCGPCMKVLGGSWKIASKVIYYAYTSLEDPLSHHSMVWHFGKFMVFYILSFSSSCLNLLGFLHSLIVKRNIFM